MSDAVDALTINVQGSEIAIFKYQDMDFISLTDMVKNLKIAMQYRYWLRNKDTLLF